jgi:hypothetical protein
MFQIPKVAKIVHYPEPHNRESKHHFRFEGIRFAPPLDTGIDQERALLADLHCRYCRGWFTVCAGYANFVRAKMLTFRMLNTGEMAPRVHSPKNDWVLVHTAHPVQPKHGPGIRIFLCMLTLEVTHEADLPE